MINNINKKNHRCHSLTNGLAHTCHSLTSNSEEIRNLNQMPYLAHAQGMTEERGRSMVEMLGVLAVIGVLSVGGIAGYKTAMTKHQANELLSEASKRAVVVAAQMLQGRTLSMGEFGNANVSGLGVGFNPEIVQDGNLFTIKTNGNIDKLICKEVYKLVGDKSIVRLLQSGAVDVTSEDKCATAPLAFTYNSELTNVGAGFNGHFDPDDPTQCAEGWGGNHCNSCDDGYILDNGNCVECNLDTINDSEACCLAIAHIGMVDGVCCMTSGDSDACCKKSAGDDAVRVDDLCYVPDQYGCPTENYGEDGCPHYTGYADPVYGGKYKCAWVSNMCMAVHDDGWWNCPADPTYCNLVNGCRSNSDNTLCLFSNLPPFLNGVMCPGDSYITQDICTSFTGCNWIDLPGGYAGGKICSSCNTLTESLECT